MRTGIAVIIALVPLAGLIWAARRKNWRVAGALCIVVAFVMAQNCIPNLGMCYQDIDLHTSEGEAGWPITKAEMNFILVNCTILLSAVLLLMGSALCFYKARGNKSEVHGKMHSDNGLQAVCG